MLRVARNWKSFRGEAEFRTWLYRIVIDVFRDRLEARNPADQSLASNPADRRAGDPAAETQIAELAQIVARRASELPPRQREVMVLTACEGLSTAAVSGCRATRAVSRDRGPCRLKESPSPAPFA